MLAGGQVGALGRGQKGGDGERTTTTGGGGDDPFRISLTRRSDAIFQWPDMYRDELVKRGRGVRV